MLAYLRFQERCAIRSLTVEAKIFASRSPLVWARNMSCMIKATISSPSAVISTLGCGFDDLSVSFLDDLPSFPRFFGGSVSSAMARLRHHINRYRARMGCVRVCEMCEWYSSGLTPAWGSAVKCQWVQPCARFAAVQFCIRTHSLWHRPYERHSSLNPV